MNRPELADFLRSRRARLRPSDVGLEGGRRRRTPGLRREEVARLAAISVDYYTRLEQARGASPSHPVLTGLARALRLSDGERAYLYDLACVAPGHRDGPPQDVPAGILHLLDRLDDTPAYVTDAKWDVLAWNALAAALIVDFSTLAPGERNAMRWLFLPGAEPGPPGAEPGRPDDDHEALAREAVADLRAASARYPNDPGVAGLVEELRSGSPRFRSLWDDHQVRVRRSVRKRADHPVVGRIDVDSETLIVAEQDQRLVLYTAAPGTRSYDALRLLRVVGSQDLGRVL